MNSVENSKFQGNLIASNAREAARISSLMVETATLPIPLWTSTYKPQTEINENISKQGNAAYLIMTFKLLNTKLQLCNKNVIIEYSPNYSLDYPK